MLRDGLVIQNGGELERKFESLPRGMRSRAVNTVLRRASKPIIQAARANLAGKHEVTGTLKKRMGARFKSYRRGVVRIAVIGPRWPAGKDFSQLGSLIEFGTVTRHALGRKTGFAKSIYRAATNLGRYFRGRIEPTPFLRPAFLQQKGAALKIMAKDTGAIIDKLARKKS